MHTDETRKNLLSLIRYHNKYCYKNQTVREDIGMLDDVDVTRLKDKLYTFEALLETAGVNLDGIEEMLDQTGKGFTGYLKKAYDDLEVIAYEISERHGVNLNLNFVTTDKAQMLHHAISMKKLTGEDAGQASIALGALSDVYTKPYSLTPPMRVQDWRMDDSAEDIPEDQQKVFLLSFEENTTNATKGVWFSMVEENGDPGDGLHGLIEVRNGRPAITLGMDPDNNALHVDSVSKHGLMVRPDSPTNEPQEQDFVSHSHGGMVDSGFMYPGFFGPEEDEDEINGPK